MNGNDIVIHIERCSECQQRQSKMESGSENAKAELESQIELCLSNHNQELDFIPNRTRAEKTQTK